jgi:hypothetical protein
MIVAGEGLMINPAHVARVVRFHDAYWHKWEVRLLSAEGNTLSDQTFDIEAEADLFLDYVCEEIDKANGIYKETNGTEDNIS